MKRTILLLMLQAMLLSGCVYDDGYGYGGRGRGYDGGGYRGVERHERDNGRPYGAPRYHEYSR